MEGAPADGVEEKLEKPAPRHYEWAELTHRTIRFDVLACPKCNGRLKLIAMFEQPEVIEKILSHLRLPTEAPRPQPACAPPEEPEQLELFDPPEQIDLPDDYDD